MRNVSLEFSLECVLIYKINRGYAHKLLYSVKQVVSLPVQFFCMCFIKYRDVLLQMPSKEIPTMSITDVHHICRLIFKRLNFFIFLNKTPTIKTTRLVDYLKSRYRHQFVLLLTLSPTCGCDETCFTVWSDDIRHIPHSLLINQETRWNQINHAY